MTLSRKKLNLPAKKAKACRKTDIKMNAVVRTCDRFSYHCFSRKKSGRTLNNRGGMIGERVVNISLKVATISSAIPTTSGAIVCGVDPALIELI